MRLRIQDNIINAIHIRRNEFLVKKDQEISIYNQDDMNEFIGNYVLPETILKNRTANFLYLKTSNNKLPIVRINDGATGNLTSGSYVVLKTFESPIKELYVSFKNLTEKLSSIKSVKNLTGIGLKEAKDFTDDADILKYNKEKYIQVELPEYCTLQDIYDLSKQCEFLRFKIILQDNTGLYFNI